MAPTLNSLTFPFPLSLFLFFPLPSLLHLSFLLLCSLPVLHVVKEVRSKTGNPGENEGTHFYKQTSDDFQSKVPYVLQYLFIP